MVVAWSACNIGPPPGFHSLNPNIHPMKTNKLVASLVIGLGLLTQALIAQGGPANGRGPARPDSAPIGNPEACPYFIDGQCPAGEFGVPGECPRAIDGTCPMDQVGPNGDRPGCPGNGGVCPNPDGEPKRDGTGGPGKPANPAGPQDGTAPGQGHRGGRG